MIAGISLSLRDQVCYRIRVISDMCIAEGYKGILFPSSALSGGTNLVVFNSTLVVADKLVTFDPNGDLPKNQASWA